MVIEGPKACGKTETARRVAASEVRLDIDDSARQAAEIDPSLVIDGQTPRLLDEWQEYPRLWNHVRRAVDDRPSPGQFILTGSATPADSGDRHTGAGRFSFLRMRPMSLYESGDSTGDVSLAALMRGEMPRAAEAECGIAQIAERIVVGGWPATLDLDVGRAARANHDYLEQVSRVDVRHVAGPRRDPQRVQRLLAALARNVATEAPDARLADDAGDGNQPLNRHTVRDYLDALERLMLVEDQPAWAPHLRSRRRVRRSAKRHFVDPSLAAAALRAEPARLLEDLGLLGRLFESLVVRDLRVLSQAIDGGVRHYRDDAGIEVDAIIELADGRWAAFEVKLGQGQIEQGATTLRRFCESVDTDRSGSPAGLTVICPGGYAYQRVDGVNVVPLTALGP
ncbi:ATP-binding protein [Egibacter rhizosphaerae]|uniref:ATP-binding protein n=1 Tax=Egibacter rhizosphaerae TaxID=1670831 RepID=UPI00197A886B|nr:ATP-binding protein [Egibacter rhizosphaerae]